MSLLSCSRRNLQREPFSSADDFNHILLAGFHFSERVGVVVNVMYVAPGDLDNSITSFQSSICCWRVIAHTVEQQAVVGISIIGNRTEIDTKTGGSPGRFAFSYCVGGSFVSLIDITHDACDQTEYARLSFVVDLIGSVGWLMVILVSAGPEKQHGNLFGIKRRMIAWAVTVFIQREVKSPGGIH